MDVAVFIVSAIIVLGGAVGVVVNPNPVRAALSLVASFFGVAVLFVLQEAHFLALVQVVVYGGAIVVLFLFVIMLLGVDKVEDIRTEPLVNQRPAALAGGAVMLLLIFGGLFLSGPGGEQGAVAITGQPEMSQALDAPGIKAGGPTSIDPTNMREPDSNVVALARDLFTRNLFAFEATALLLTIATVGAVVLVRNQGAEDLVVDEPGTANR
ncbi:MAG: NADH-quinone oxidoreductase subunit J [Acidimicrobiales bacterium]